MGIAFLLFLLGCSSEEVVLHNVPYTTARIGDYQPQGNTDLELKIYSNEKQCSQLLNDLQSTEETLEDCMPYIDRIRRLNIDPNLVAYLSTILFDLYTTRRWSQ